MIATPFYHFGLFAGGCQLFRCRDSLLEGPAFKINLKGVGDLVQHDGTSCQLACLSALSLTGARWSRRKSGAGAKVSGPERAAGALLALPSAGAGAGACRHLQALWLLVSSRLSRAMPPDLTVRRQQGERRLLPALEE